MGNDNNIALFMDLDNAVVDIDGFNSIRDQLKEMGRVSYVKLYGVSDRKHKAIIDIAAVSGYEMLPPLQSKKRGSKVFDHRIAIDAIDIVAQNPNIGTIAIVSAHGDMVHLYSKLRFYNLHILSLDDGDENNMAFVDSVLHRDCNTDSGKEGETVHVVKPVKAAALKNIKPKKKPKDDGYADNRIDNDLSVLKQIRQTDNGENNLEEEELLAQVRNLLSEFNEE